MHAKALLPTSMLPLTIVLALWAGGADGDDWTRFRGPDGLGESEAIGIPVAWTEADFAWRVALPGVGHSSPVVAGDRLYVTAGDEDSGGRSVVCLNAADGSQVWKRTFPGETYRKHAFNSYAAMTPPLDDERLYLTWTTPEAYMVVALRRADGQEVWRRDLGPWVGEHGSGASPILFDGKLIVPNDQDVDSFCIALDPATGETRWKLDRRSEKAAYSTPIIYRPKEAAAQLILTSWAHGISGHDPQTGKSLWELPLFSKRAVGSPTVAAGLVVAGCGEGGGGKRLVAVAPGVPEKGVEARLAYDFQGSLPYVPVPVAHGDLLFLWSDSGVVTCCDAPTGNVHWRERVGGKYFASPIRIQDRLYCPSREGDMVVLAASQQYRLLGTSPLGEGTQATPAVAGGRLYVRTDRHVLAIGPTAAPAKQAAP
jgi:outer membrane protein assembly factor BamB